MSLIGPLLLIVAVSIGWVLTLFSLPGNWLMLGATALYALLAPTTGTGTIGWPIVATLAMLAVVGELVELLAGLAGAARAGGSRRGAVLALVGSVVGALVGMVVGIPIPWVGSIVAALLFAGLGALAGALVGEVWAGRTFDESWPVGVAAFWGRLLGTLGKLLIGSVMAALVVAALWW